MMLTDRIQESVERLPPAFQAEVLDFVEYLLAKAERRTLKDEAASWYDLSLSAAMRGMEYEDTPAYTMSDLKVVFS